MLRERFPDVEIRDLSPTLDALRAVKSPREIDVLRRSGHLSALAVAEAMRVTKPGVAEHQLGAVANYVYLAHGAKGEGYRAIIASGANAWHTHYFRNSSIMRGGDLVLMDTAPDCGHYTSDIGRMWPVNGTYALWQRELYGFMVEYHKVLLALLRPGVTADQIMDEAAAQMAKVVEATAFSKDVFAAAARRTLEFKGHLSHPVGMAVHDVGGCRSAPLRPATGPTRPTRPTRPTFLPCTRAGANPVRFDLKSGTDLAVHALFDPAAMLHVLNDRDLELVTEDTLESDVQAGNLLLYSWGSDGGTTFRVFVDHDVDEQAAARARGKVEGLLLRVPSGKLVATGIEYLCRPGQEPVTAEAYAPDFAHMGQSALIPPGDYLADAFEIEPEQGENKPTALDTVTCFSCAATVIGVAICTIAVLVGALLGKDWRWDWFYAGVALLILWPPVLLVSLIVKKLLSSRRRARRASEWRRRLPFDAVVVLRPFPADRDPSSARGGRFGCAYVEPRAQGEGVTSSVVI